MIINKILIDPFFLSFKSKYLSSKSLFLNRSGWIIRIYSENMVGIGEASPLINFSDEGYEQAGYGLEGFKLAVCRDENLSLDELLNYCDAHGELQPSVKFALETAVYDLESKLSSKPLNIFLNKNAYPIVQTNYVEGNSVPLESKFCMKIKIGHRNIFDEIEYIESIIKDNQNVKLRLDFNESYDLTKAIRFCKMLDGYPIDYLEQPIDKNNLEDLSELRFHTDIPIALDESVRDIDSVYKIIENQSADVLVIKPMISGGFRQTKKIIDIARKEGLRVNIGSLLESGVGRRACLHMASAYKIDEECGLSTGDLFVNDICSFPDIINGLFDVSGESGIGEKNVTL